MIHKNFKICLLIALLITPCLVCSITHAMLMAPDLYIEFITKTIGGDDGFVYNIDSYGGVVDQCNILKESYVGPQEPTVDDYEEVCQHTGSISNTFDGLANSVVGAYLNHGNKIKVYQSATSSWQRLEINCKSEDDHVLIENFDDYSVITISNAHNDALHNVEHPAIICTFTNKNLLPDIFAPRVTEDDEEQDGKGVADKTGFSFNAKYANPDGITAPDYVNLIIEDSRQNIISTTEAFPVFGGQDIVRGETFISATSTFPKGKYVYYFESKIGDSIIQTSTSSFSTGYSSVVFLPGLEASRLYEVSDNQYGEKEGERVWEPEIFQDNSKLYLDKNGKSINKNIYTRDIIDTAYIEPSGDIYKSFISSMDNMVSSGLIKYWEAIPYDWRLSLDQIINSCAWTSFGYIGCYDDYIDESAYYLPENVQDDASMSDTGKVIIVAHSNGGLLTKKLIDNLGNEASKFIEKIIFVAVPQIGTPSAIGALLHGFDQGLPKDWLPLFISPNEARILGNNMPSAYNLLPSMSYFNSVSSPVVVFDDSELLSSWRSKYGDAINSSGRLYQFLSDQSRETLPVSDDLIFPATLNKMLLDNSVEIHNEELDGWVPPERIELIEIAGWGEDTVSGIEYYQGEKRECSGPRVCTSVPTLEYKPIITSDGDGTVVTPSALWSSVSTGVKKYWVDLNDYNITLIRSHKHADILEIPELRSLIQNLILENDDFLPDYISNTVPSNSKLENRLRFTLHSPLSLDLYDENGNHTGISTTTNELEENIPGSRYITFGEVKYISVPESNNLSVSMQGYSSGSFTLDIDEVQGDSVIASTTFSGIQSSTSTIATLVIPDGNITDNALSLNVDEDGDGVTDETFIPKAIATTTQDDVDIPTVFYSSDRLVLDSDQSTTTLVEPEQVIDKVSSTSSFTSTKEIEAPIIESQVIEPDEDILPTSTEEEPIKYEDKKPEVILQKTTETKLKNIELVASDTEQIKNKTEDKILVASIGSSSIQKKITIAFTTIFMICLSVLFI